MPGSSTPQSRLPVLHRRSSDDRNPDDNVVDPSWQAQLPARVLDEIDVGVLLCDIHRRVRMSNWTAQRELECARLLRIGCGLLCSSVNECGLSEAIAVACTRGRRQIVALGRGDERLYVSVSPLPFLWKTPASSTAGSCGSRSA